MEHLEVQLSFVAFKMSRGLEPTWYGLFKLTISDYLIEMTYLGRHSSIEEIRKQFPGVHEGNLNSG